MRSLRRQGERDRGRVRWDPKPHNQLAILSAAALAALVTVVVVMVVRIGQVDASYARVVNRATPITDALTTAELRYQSTFAHATVLYGPLTDAQRTTAIADLTDKTRQADATWGTYKRLAVGYRGESVLQTRAERAEAEQIRLITPALSGSLTAAGPSRIAQASATQIAAIESLRQHYLTARAREMGTATRALDRADRDLFLTSGIEVAFLCFACAAAYGSVRRRDRQVRASEVERATDAQRNDLETRLARSLEMVHAEAAVYPRVARAISEVAADRPGEVLIADSSHARLRQIVALGTAADGGGCPVSSPGECPAIARGQTQVFAHSGALDACPYLEGRPTGPCSAACVPLSIGAKTLGIVHVTGAAGCPPDPEIVARLEIVARKTGDRIGMLRAFTRSETEAHTDQLTGLLNRRSLKSEVHRIIAAGQQYTVAYGDLDHFKQVNDIYGHDAGDRALRVFSRVLRDSVRPDDIPSRYGGEEFVVVLPDCSIADAIQVLERVRENLARAQVSAASPPCTVSFGVATSDEGVGFDDVLKIADHALAEAKEQGRDRIIASTAPTVST